MAASHDESKPEGVVSEKLVMSQQKEEEKGEAKQIDEKKEIICDDMYPLHFEIVFKRVTKVAQIEQREHEL